MAACVHGVGVLDTLQDDGIADMPIQLQESMLVEDLLYALLGVEGTHILVKRDGDGAGAGGGAASDYGSVTSGAGAGAGGAASTAFEGIDASMRSIEFYLADRDGINESLAFLVDRVLPLCRYYVRCSWYAEMRSRYEAGLVANAFAAACRLLLREYTLLVAQLENFARQGRLSLQKLWFFLQPSMRTLSTLDAVIFASPFAMGTTPRVCGAVWRCGCVHAWRRSTVKPLFLRLTIVLLRWCAVELGAQGQRQIRRRPGSRRGSIPAGARRCTVHSHAGEVDLLRRAGGSPQGVHGVCVCVCGCVCVCVWLCGCGCVAVCMCLCWCLE